MKRAMSSDVMMAQKHPTAHRISVIMRRARAIRKKLAKISQLEASSLELSKEQKLKLSSRAALEEELEQLNVAMAKSPDLVQQEENRREGKKKEAESTVCTICNLTFNDSSSLSAHLSGKRHKKMLKKIGNIESKHVERRANGSETKENCKGDTKQDEKKKRMSWGSVESSPLFQPKGAMPTPSRLIPSGLESIMAEQERTSVKKSPQRTVVSSPSSSSSMTRKSSPPFFSLQPYSPGKQVGKPRQTKLSSFMVPAKSEKKSRSKSLSKSPWGSPQESPELCPELCSPSLIPGLDSIMQDEMKSRSLRPSIAKRSQMSKWFTEDNIVTCFESIQQEEMKKTEIIVPKEDPQEDPTRRTGKKNKNKNKNKTKKNRNRNGQDGKISRIVEMGFTVKQARGALQKSGWKVEVAVSKLLHT